MKYQLCSTDEYGSTLIHDSSDDIDKLVRDAKKTINDANVTNPFTADQKKENWELCFVELVDEDGDQIDDAFYAGKNNRGKPCVQQKDGDKNLIEISSTQAKIRVYLGRLDGSDWYASKRTPTREKNAQGQNVGAVRLEEKQVDDPADPVLTDKNVYFIRRVS